MPELGLQLKKGKQASKAFQLYFIYTVPLVIAGETMK